MAEIPPEENKEAYEPKPALWNAAAVGLQFGIAGVVVSTIQNALGNHSFGAAGVLTRTGGTIGTFAAMGAVFALTDAVVANQRQTADALNGAAGGCASGFLAGVRAHSLPMAVAGCAILGAAVGTFDYAGELAGRSPEEKEERRKKFFKPVTQPAVPASN